MMRAAMSTLACLALCLSFGSRLAAQPGTPGPTETVDSQLHASVAFYEEGDYRQSLQAAQRALDLTNTQLAIAYNNICSARTQLGEYAQAAQACNEALNLYPDYERAWNNLALVYEKVVEETPTVGAYLNLSVARYRQDRLDDSLAASRRALELDPANAIAHNNICAAFAKDGQWEPAVRECRTALELDPDYERAKNNLEWALSREDP